MSGRVIRAIGKLPNGYLSGCRVLSKESSNGVPVKYNGYNPTQYQKYKSRFEARYHLPRSD